MRLVADSVQLAKADQLCLDGRAQRLVLRAQRKVRIRPAFTRVEPDRVTHEVRRFPVIARPDVGVQERVSVPEDLEIDAAKRWVEALARTHDGSTETVEIVQELL